jgi:cytoskeletal protein CcmA (bactofilin family)
MFGRSTKQPKPASATAAYRKDMNPSVIASNMCVLGNIVSDGILDIDGQVDGNVRGHMVTVRPNGRIRGDVLAEDAHVHGVVEGLIKAKNVTVYATAQVNGTIMHESLTVEDGASVDGKLKRMEPALLEDHSGEQATTVQQPLPPTAMPPTLDSMFDNDNDQPQSEREIKILENLRLIS